MKNNIRKKYILEQNPNNENMPFEITDTNDEYINNQNNQMENNEVKLIHFKLHINIHINC